jgi:hypothetical protein
MSIAKKLAADALARRHPIVRGRLADVHERGFDVALRAGHPRHRADGDRAVHGRDDPPGRRPASPARCERVLLEVRVLVAGLFQSGEDQFRGRAILRAARHAPADGVRQRLEKRRRAALRHRRPGDAGGDVVLGVTGNGEDRARDRGQSTRHDSFHGFLSIPAGQLTMAVSGGEVTPPVSVLTRKR